MSGKIIQRIPYPINDGKNRCPFCWEKLSELKKVLVQTRKKDIVNIELPYCPNCDISYWGNSANLNKWDFYHFRINSGVSEITTLNYMYDEYKRGYQVPNNVKPFKRIKRHEVTESMTYINYVKGDRLKRCPDCGGNLTPGIAEMSFYDYFIWAIEGLSCKACDTLHVRKSNMSYVHEIRNTITNVENYLNANGDAFGAYVVVAAMDTNNKIEFYIIVFDKMTIDSKHNVYLYSSLKGREILSAAFAYQRYNHGSIDGEEFTVVGTRIIDPDDNDILNLVNPRWLNLKKDHGLYNPKLNGGRYEIVDALLYSPFNDRYEIIKATLDKEDYELYTDSILYRNFVNKYGNPRTELYPVSNGKGRIDFKNLNEESIIKTFGYDVSYNSNLSTEERRKILADIVDLEILSPGEVSKHLEFCCTMHSGDRFISARQKWESDKEFIENYKCNPQKFLIAE